MKLLTFHLSTTNISEGYRGSEPIVLTERQRRFREQHMSKVSPFFSGLVQTEKRTDVRSPVPPSQLAGTRFEQQTRRILGGVSSPPARHVNAQPSGKGHAECECARRACPFRAVCAGVRIYRTGQTWAEPAFSYDITTRNASTDEPARALVVLITEEADSARQENSRPSADNK
jgi:hypothetical protein